MKIAIGSDHAGYQYKEQIKQFLEENDHEFHDFGTHSEKAVDYPLFIRPVAEAVGKGEYDRGIVLGGSGNGEAMVANRVRGIRCALCWNIETALLARKHNDANMLSVGARMCSVLEALEIVRIWLETPFEGGRHLRRIKQIDQKSTLGSRPGLTKKGKNFADEEKPTPTREVSKKTINEKYDVLITFRYILYSEGKNTLEFEVDPGLKRPSIIKIPSPQRWNSEFPQWARNRREEIINRVRAKCVHMNCEWEEY